MTQQPEPKPAKRRVRAEQVPEEVARWILEHHEPFRSPGRIICFACGERYDHHPEVITSYYLLCDGRLNKT